MWESQPHVLGECLLTLPKLLQSTSILKHCTYNHQDGIIDRLLTVGLEEGIHLCVFRGA